MTPERTWEIVGFCCLRTPTVNAILQFSPLLALSEKSKNREKRKEKSWGQCSPLSSLETLNVRIKRQVEGSFERTNHNVEITTLMRI